MAFVLRYRRRILTLLILLYVISVGAMVYFIPIGPASPLFNLVYPAKNRSGEVAKASGFSTLAELLRERGCCFFDSKYGIAGGNEPDSSGAAAQVLGQLVQAHAHYPPPLPMRLGRAGEIVFVIEGTVLPVHSQSHVFRNREAFVSILVSDQVSARLDGPGTDVSIALRGEDKQIVSPIGPTRWTWEVTPKVGGTIVLRLGIFAWVKIGDGRGVASNEHRIEIKTAEIPIFVQVTGWEQIKILAGEVQPVWGATAMVVGGIGSLLVWLGWKPRRKVNGDKPKEGAPANTA
jgi:hypothetical protein